MMIEFTKEEQDKLGNSITNLKDEFDKLLSKYNFEYDGPGQDLVSGYFDFFYNMENDK
jgi:hypothetical protein